MPEDSDFKLEKQRQLELQVWRFDYSFSENQWPLFCHQFQCVYHYKSFPLWSWNLEAAK